MQLLQSEAGGDAVDQLLDGSFVVIYQADVSRASASRHAFRAMYSFSS